MKYKLKTVIFAWAFLVLSSNLFSQSIETQVLSYQRNFARAGLETKYELVKDAGKYLYPETASFFLFVLDYVDAVYDLLQYDTTLVQMASTTVSYLSELENNSSLLKIRLLFLKIKDASFQEACIKAFQKLKPTDPTFISELNEQFESIFYKSVSGQAYSPSLLNSYAECLGVIGNQESFSVLFKSLIQSTDETYKKLCYDAISKIDINIFDELVGIIEKKDIYYTWTAFEIAQETEKLSENELANITALSLSVAINATNVSPDLSNKLISKVLNLLTVKKWQHSTSLVVQYFHSMQTEFRTSNAKTNELIAAINCMAVLRSKECATSLVVFLGLLNSDTERGLAYNEQVVLAVIKALGELGDNNAFDYLVYVDYLNYSQTIKQAARDSIARLKW